MSRNTHRVHTVDIRSYRFTGITCEETGVKETIVIDRRGPDEVARIDWLQDKDDRLGDLRPLVRPPTAYWSMRSSTGIDVECMRACIDFLSPGLFRRISNFIMKKGNLS